jgi:hypothetical protein
MHKYVVQIDINLHYLFVHMLVYNEHLLFKMHGVYEHKSKNKM